MSRGARLAKIATILVLDAVLVGVGIAMILSYAHARERVGEKRSAAKIESGVAAAAPSPDSAAATAPEDIRPKKAVAVAEKPTKTATGDREASKGHRKKPHESARRERRSPRPEKSGRSDTPEEPDPGGADPSDTTPGAGTDPDGAGAGAPGGSTDTTAEPTQAEIGQVHSKVALLVARNSSKLQRCYQQAAKSTTPDNPLAGMIHLHFEIVASGHADNVRVDKNETGSQQLAQCVVALFESWTFPKPPGNKPLQLIWPLRFKAPPP